MYVQIDRDTNAQLCSYQESLTQQLIDLFYKILLLVNNWNLNARVREKRGNLRGGQQKGGRAKGKGGRGEWEWS